MDSEIVYSLKNRILYPWTSDESLKYFICIMMESKEKLEKRSAAQGLIHIGESASKNSARSCENNVAGSSSLHKFYKENRAKSKLLQ